MKREDKVISLELAQKIDEWHKRLGIEVESEWWWNNVPLCQAEQPKICKFAEPIAFIGDEHYSWHSTDKEENIIFEKYKYPAYDCAELGKMLSEYSVIKADTMIGKKTALAILNHRSYQDCKEKIHYVTEYRCIHSSYAIHPLCNDKTETESRGKMYLWLLEHGYIEGERQ
jgi:hypothetical protein